MSDDILDPTPSPLKATPSALMSRSAALSRQADDARKRGKEMESELASDRDNVYATHKEKAAALGKAEDSAYSDLASATEKGPDSVAMPNPDLGPAMDQGQARNFMFGILGMALIGRKGSRENWKLSLAAMNGALKGFKEGNLDAMKAKQDQFKREFDTALQKQKQANDKYRSILDSKQLSLNAQMARIAVEAKAYGDEVTYEAAKRHDVEAVWKQAGQAETAADKLAAQATKMQSDLDAKREKAEAKAKADAGNQGISQKYQSDPEYKKRVDFWANYVKDGNSLPPRFAQSGAGKAMFSDIMSVVPSLGGGDSKEMRAGAVELAGQKSEARALGTRTAAIEQAASEAREMSGIVLKTSAAFDRTSFPPINRALVAFENNTGDTKVRQFGASVNSYINAYARAVNPTGVGTVSDKEHAREMLSTADSDEQVKAIIAVLDQEMTAAQHSPKNVKKSLREEITGGGGAPKPPSSGTVEDGYRFKGGDPADRANWEKAT